MQLLERLCSLRAPSGDERAMTDFVLEHIREQSPQWACPPKVIAGDELHENIILVFGDSPRTAVFAHMDSIGFTVRYGRQLVRIGGPEMQDGFRLVGADSRGEIDCELEVDDEESGFGYRFHREIDRGTSLTFKPHFRLTDDYVQCCCLDNRLGVWCALRLAETLRQGIIVFSTREEHGGGATAMLGRLLAEEYGIRRALICDITWATEGVYQGRGVVLSMRDKGLPRRVFIDGMIALAKESGIPFQLEVEGAGGSDGSELQAIPYAWEWMFIGAAEDNIHSPDERVHRRDAQSMLEMYRYLMGRIG